jgi:glycosyltransferase involved in cell wall biosynthesis
MAFAEALAHGLPVVGTTAGAIPETVPAAASLLVPPGDRDALAAALRLLLDNAALRARLAAGAAVAGAALPDWPAATRHWMAAFDRLVA